MMPIYVYVANTNRKFNEKQVYRESPTFTFSFLDVGTSLDLNSIGLAKSRI